MTMHTINASACEPNAAADEVSTVKVHPREPGTSFVACTSYAFTKIGIPEVDEAHETFIRDLAAKKKCFKVYTRAEVAKHNTEADFWVIIDDVVYDLTKYVNHHPGGEVFLLYAGKDASDEYAAFHTPYVMQTLAKSFAIGCVSEPETRAQVLEFRRARHNIYATHIDRDKHTPYHTLYYTFKVSLAVVLGLAAAYFASGLNLQHSNNVDNWVAVALAVWAAMLYATCTQQAAFVAHDCLHNEVFETRRSNHWLGLFVGNFLMGTSSSWWKWSHNIHHLSTNSFDHDLDITHMPFFAVNAKMLKGKFDNRAARLLASLQKYTFIPIIFLSRLNLHAQSYIHILNPKRRIELRIPEIISLTLHFAIEIWIMSLMNSTALRIIFMVISYIIMGSLGFQLTVSHWALPTHEGMHNSSFVNMQILGSQNIITYIYNDWYYGGLNYQTEHHLFPRIPRYCLSTVKRNVIEPFCKKFSLVYTDNYFWYALGNLLTHLGNEAEKFSSGKQKAQ